ncbi:MAG: flavodoxin family protein [Peptococcaceae bacterium]|nr:flavodoxin family protein [Peptococcaceae bacterium]
MPINIVVVTGSPRSKGNSEFLADAFIEGAEESGNIITKFNVGKMEIKGCIACEYCFSHNGTCAQDDDMQEIYSALHKAEMLVFASPIYYYGFTSQLKAVIDRLYASYGRENFFSIKSTILLLTCEEEAVAAESAILQYKTIVKYLGWQDKGVIVQELVNKKGEIQGKKSLEIAKKMAMNLQDP